MEVGDGLPRGILKKSPQDSKCSTQLPARPSTSPAVVQWRGGGSRTSHVQELWRSPGHIDDGAYSDSVHLEKKAERKAKAEKRLAGDFVVGASPCHSVELPSPPSRRGTRCKASVWRSPYSDSWNAVGAPPLGRWVLDQGRPRFVPDGPTSSLSEASVEAWFNGYKEVSDTSKEKTAEERPKSVPQKLRIETKRSKSKDGVVSPVALKHFDTGPSDPSASSSEGEKGSDDEVESFPAQRKGSPASDSPSSRRSADDPASSSVQDSVLRTRRSLKSHVRLRAIEIGKNHDIVEELNDILKPLDQLNSKEEKPETLPRFAWLGGRTSKVRKVNRFFLETLDRNSPAAVDSPPGKTTKSRRASLIGRGLSLSGNRGSLPGKPSTSFGRQPSLGKTSTSLGRQPSLAFLGRSATRSGSIGSGADVSASAGRRKQDRDQRSELKRLQQMLLSSDQQVFEAEIWEACGIEGEHLKRQQFAALIHGGLSFGAKAQEQEEADATAEDASTADPFSPIFPSFSSRASVKTPMKGKRVTISLGVNFKGGSQDEEDVKPEPQAKSIARRKSRDYGSKTDFTTKFLSRLADTVSATSSMSSH